MLAGVRTALLSGTTPYAATAIAAGRTGINLANNVYYAGGRNLMNLAQYAAWQTNTGYTVTLDANGNVTSTNEPGGNFFRVINNHGTAGAPVSVTATWTGGSGCTTSFVGGTAATSGANTRSQTFSFTTSTIYNMVFGVVITDAAAYAADPIKNLVVRETSLSASLTWDPNYVTSLAAYDGPIRFMDMQGTNGNTGTQLWSNRALPTDMLWGTKKDGIPVEWIAELATLTGNDIWVCIPWGAEDAYVTNFLTYLRDNIPMRQKIYVELQNEIWNTGFLTMYNTAKNYGATIDTSLNDTNDPSGVTRNALGHRTRHNYVMGLAAAAFAATPGRIVRVLAGQVKNLSRLFSSTYALNNNNNVDMLASAPYFLRAGADTPSYSNDPDTVIGRMPLNIDTEGALEIETDSLYAASRGLPYGPYEMGNHLLMNSPADDTALNTILDDERMFQVLGQYFAELRRRSNASLSAPANFMYFTDVGRSGSGPAGRGYSNFRFSLRKTKWDTDAASPLYRAYMQAKAGTYPAYVRGTDGDLAVSGTRYNGNTLSTIVPTMYNAVSATINWTRNGADISGTSVTAVAGATIAYVQTSADVGAVIKPKLTLTASAPFTTQIYTSSNSTTTIALTKFVAFVSGTSITVPSDMGSSAVVHCIGAAGQGFSSTNGNDYHHGGGGGAYAKKALTLTPGATIPIQIGTAGGSGTANDTWFSSTSSVLAKGGTSATSTSGGKGLGGAAASCVGDTVYGGGDGGSVPNTFAAAGGGGGAAGPSGAGAPGSAPNTSANAGGGGAANGGAAGSTAVLATGLGRSGGNNRLGTGGGAGATTTAAGQSGTNGGGGGGGGGTAGFTAAGNGSTDPVWDLTAGATTGPGGGGGGGYSSSGLSAAGNGGTYGGGAGGARMTTFAAAGQGLIVLEYIVA